MHCLNLTLPETAENLALDEALLEHAEAAGSPCETLRLWEPAQPAVVVGRSSRIAEEVDLAACRALGVDVLRRVSGGAAIVTGPGCLMYAVVLSLEMRPALRTIDRAHRLVLSTIAAALEPLTPGVRCRGTSDLVIADAGGERKFSGNSVRCRRRHLLYHGTLLYDFPLELIGRCLTMPPRQPAYRQGRDHQAFVGNLPLTAAAIRASLIAAWDATEPAANWPRQLTARLAAEKYRRREWNEQL